MEELFENAQTLNVRVLNKIDEYGNWMSDESAVLGKGEIAIATIDSGDATGLIPPAVGIRVGNGKDKFKDLPWIQATAGDVHAWAKKATPDFGDLNETYKARLAEYITGVAESDTNTTYEFFYNDNVLTIMSYGIGDKEAGKGEVVGTFTIDDTTKVLKVAGATVNNIAVFAANGQIADAGKSLNDYVAKSEVAGYDFATKGELAEEVAELTNITTSLNTELGKTNAAVGELQAADVTLQANIDTKMAKVTGDAVEATDSNVAVSSLVTSTALEAKKYATQDALTAAVSELQTADTDLDTRLTAEEGKVAGLQTSVGNLETAVGVLNGEGEGSVKKAIDAAINKFAEDITDNDTIDTFKEVVDYISKHGDVVAGFVEDISELQDVAHDHDNMDELKTITGDDLTAWRAAVQSISGVEVAAKADNNIEITGVSTDLLKQGSKTIVFNCGNAF